MNFQRDAACIVSIYYFQSQLKYATAISTFLLPFNMVHCKLLAVRYGQEEEEDEKSVQKMSIDSIVCWWNRTCRRQCIILFTLMRMQINRLAHRPTVDRKYDVHSDRTRNYRRLLSRISHRFSFYSVLPMQLRRQSFCLEID